MKMKFTGMGASLVAALLSLFLFSCDFSQETPGETGETGVLGIRIQLDRAGSGTFAKVATGDTTFKLDSLKIILTSPGSPTQTHSFAISGDAASGPISVSTRYVTVTALKVWKAKIFSIDTTLNPTRTDTVHIDSVTFSVFPSDTTFISPTLNASYSVLKQRIVSNFADSVLSGVRYLRLRVDGVTRDSIALGMGLNSVSFGSSTVGVAVGDGGTILRTTNGGTSWTRQNSGTTLRLNSVFMPTSSIVWAVGDSGIILESTNGGVNWTIHDVGTTVNLNEVNGLPGVDEDVWVVGNAGTILHTFDGGEVWHYKNSGTTKNLYSVCATASAVAWAAGEDGALIKTTNWITWVPRNSGTTNDLYSIRFAPSSATVGWIAGANGFLRKTRDSSTWTSRNSNTTRDLRSIYIQGATSLGFIVGDGGVILKSTDSSTWSSTSQNSNTTELLNSIHVISTDKAVAVGPETPFVSIANATSSGNWTHLTYGSRVFDKVLGFKRLTTGASHTVMLQAIDTTAGPLRGYEIQTDLLVQPGRDTVLTTNLLGKCGYSGTPSCTP